MACFIMPTYVYRRDDGTSFEYHQSITDDPLKECPETGQSVERVITRSPAVVQGRDTQSTRSENGASGSPPLCCGPSCGL